MLFAHIPLTKLSRRAIVAVMFVANLQAFAQFNILPGEKSSTSWTEITTTNYQVIYPEGYDSIGKRYATLLEKYRPLVGYSAGYLPNQSFGASMPVVLHPFTATTNGYAALAPRRIEVFTFSDPYSSLPPVSWETLLSIHENRHAAQFQFANYGFWKKFRIFFGELAPLYVQSLYLNPALAEGDAVVAETALTESGRGRSGDFLSYYRMAFDNGDMRNWYRWRYGSQKYYTPDYYRVGYMTVAGARYLYDAPMFMSDYLHNLYNPFKFNAMSMTLRKYSGKRFDNTWADITNTFASVWSADDRVRGPFQEITPVVTVQNEYFTAYRGTVETSGGSLVAVRGALDKASELVEILADGTVKTLRPFNADSKLAYSSFTGCIYWSEAIPDIRWQMYQSSPVRMMKPGEKKIRNLTQEGRYVNPTVSDDGRFLAAVEYLMEGGCRIVLFDLAKEEEIRSISVRSGLQVNEVAFIGSEILFTGVSDDGTGIYLTDFEQVRILEQPVPFKVHDLVSRNGIAYFTSDKNGTNEIYSYSSGGQANGQNGVMKQLTNTKYGASGPFFRGDELCFTALLPEGQIPAFSSTAFSKEVKYTDRASYPIADKLTEQENQRPEKTSEYLVFSPAKYSKGANLLNIHSWIPIYYSQDAITGSMTGFYNEVTAFGIKAFLQNPTSTLSGSIGLSFNLDPFELDIPNEGSNTPPTAKFSTAIHGRLEYTGLFPVFSIAFDAGSRKPANTALGIDPEDGKEYPANVLNKYSDAPFFMGGSLTVSLPFNMSSGGWERSLTPFAGIIASNDQLCGKYRSIKWNERHLMYEPTEPIDDDLHRHIRYTAGITGTVQLPVPSSAIYPRYGIGGGVQYSGNPFARTLYASVYGYLPGITSVQGLKLSASIQSKSASFLPVPTDVWAFDMYDMEPRGLIDSEVGNILKLHYPNVCRLGVDYAMPILPVDFSLKQLVYIRNLELIPFYDYMIADSKGSSGNLFSVGTDLLFRFEKLLFINNTVKMGLRYSYNGGSLSDRMGLDEPHYLGVVVGLDY